MPSEPSVGIKALSSVREDGLVDLTEYTEEDLTRDFLNTILPQFDWENSHHADTPRRYLKMLKELTEAEEFNFTTFDNELGLDEMIIIRDIPFYTLCAHHLIPFHGEAHIAYIPELNIAGLSKFARAVRFMAKGLWVQEHLTDAIANFIESHLDPKGLAVVLEAEHLCISMRGAQVPGTRTTTSSMRGVFLDPSRKARDEFLSLIRGSQ